MNLIRCQCVRVYDTDKIFPSSYVPFFGGFFLTLYYFAVCCVYYIFVGFTRENLRRLPVFGLGLKVLYPPCWIRR